jgi:hypothetical protein
VTVKRALVVIEDAKGSEGEVGGRGRGRDRESEGRWVWQVVYERREERGERILFFMIILIHLDCYSGALYIRLYCSV